MFKNYVSVFKKDRLFILFVRSKSRKASKEKVKETVKLKALEHFDDLYGKVFEKTWPSIRLGLLSQPKYIAVLNNYGDKEKAAGFLEMHGSININKFFEYENVTISERKKKQRKTQKSNNLNDKFVKISEEKLEEEASDLYPPKSPINIEYSNIANDRFIDPSVSTSSLHEYVPATEIKGSPDYLPESQHYSYYVDSSNFTPNILDENNLILPEHLSIHTYEPGNIQSFPPPKSGSTGVSDYYLMDGGSLLPVLALDLQPEDTVLDMCAAPGEAVACNDISESRLRRVNSVFKEFFYDYKKKLTDNEIQLTQLDARHIDAVGVYNKILVDVPCTTDRHSVLEDDNSIFKASRIKERIRLPELQSEILMQALKIVAVGGTVVYSTCSLSPIQNDGVVHMVLKRMYEETDYEIVVMNMKEALEPTKILYRYSSVDLRYGHLVVPYIVNNFGPTYFCKLVRVK
ncbi:5-methylcytosine rRNA methyltransferase NSUN4 isoform X2 [Halyomorpha halys]|uniref:5-methylcytosine rRNA methyltransferase NSUN4 isoform X2 n=1 Tax=Halyomorpha halys TaxID=286706 RepID=UPI0006D5022E|nr:5-methylcytosine rRNA methyltransferase NSUN4 isoform X1 [Halyomorpha halys]